ncbi:MAG: bifunctional oligoribonuclease/PAP phosphatase NrnA [Cyclobacteriaceae bacterium]
MNSIEALLPYLDQSRSIVITTHANPDADALGSSLALYLFLKARGHDAVVISPTEYPDFLKWMAGNNEVVVFDEDNPGASQQIVDKAEVIFCLDFSGLKRIKGMEPLVDHADCVKVIIDHHLDPEDFADFMLWDTNAAATAELILDFIYMFEDHEITPEMANCIYAGIMTDTGSFKFPNTSSKTHRAIADLIDAGANGSMVSRAIYDNNSLSRLKFIGYALSEKLTVRKDLNIAYFIIHKEDYDRFNLQKGDTEGLVNFALSIAGIVMATIIKEQEDEIKLSFRSVGDYAVNKFANDHFKGGGHKNASGGMSDASLDSTVEKFESLIEDFKENYLIIK